MHNLRDEEKTFSDDMEEEEENRESVREAQKRGKSKKNKKSPQNQHGKLVNSPRSVLSRDQLENRNSGQPDILHSGPNNGQATGFSCKSINLIGAPSNVAKKALNRIGTANIAMHNMWKGIKS